jgi:2-keto-4-pentenoate hydratase
MVYAGSRYAVDSLIAARQGGVRPVRLRPEPTPAPFDEAYRWQDALLAQLGPIVGWKVGSDSPASEPFRAGLTASTVHQSPVRLD